LKRPTFILLLLAVPVLVWFQPTAAAANVCTLCWLPVGSPVLSQFGAYQAFKISWVSVGFTANSTGIVLLVIHNYLGQTVEYSTAVIQLPSGANGTSYPIVFGLVSGTYFATFFVIAPSGLSMSATTTASFSV
jgi:hypothetical protein